MNGIKKLKSVLYVLNKIYINIYMDNPSVLVLTLIVFMLLAYFLYYNVFDIIYKKQVRPLLDDFNRTRIVNKQIVWTYIEDPIFFDKDYYLQLLEKKKNVPILFKFCLQILNEKMNKHFNDLIVITPSNIKEYLPDFPIEMNAESKYTFKFRVDLLGSFLLSKYGGLFVSPGVVVLKDLDEILYNLKYKYELITFGGSIRYPNTCNDKYHPGNYIIGSQANNPTIMGYKERLLENMNAQAYVDKLVGEDLLSYSIAENNPSKYYHFGCEYTGNIDLKNNVISLDHYFGYEPIQFKDEDKLIFIALPYDLILHEKKYFWINNLSEKQFVEANTNITEIITREIYK
jgi:hypothetical protein